MRSPATPRYRTARTRLLLVLAVLAGLLPAVGAAADDPAAPAPASSAWAHRPSGLLGGGFQNVLSVSPFREPDGTRALVLGADVAGLHRSTDGGGSWHTTNAGFSRVGQYRVAAVHHSAETPGEVLACTNAGLLASVDGGRRWDLRSTAPRCDGNGGLESRIDGLEHPRATGRLLAQSGPQVWVGTLSTGVLRSGDGGRTFPQGALAGQQVRSLVAAPDDPDTLYAAVRGKGVLVSSNARGAMTFAPLTGSPLDVEEVTVVGGRLYAAARLGGIWRWDGRWTDLSSGLATGRTGSLWQSVTGRVDEATGTTVLYAGCSRPRSGASIVRSLDGGASWAPVSVPSDARTAGSSTPWWGSSVDYLALDGRAAVASSIVLDPDDPQTVWVVGRGGVHRSRDGGASWAPAVDGLLAAVTRSVLADPRRPGRVYVANTDWTLFASDDAGATVRRVAPAGSGGTGFALALDPETAPGRPSRVYLASGDRDDTGQGAVWSSPDPLDPGATWTDEGVTAAAGPARVRGIAVGHDAAGSRVLLAAVHGRGLWRKTGSTWAQVGGAGTPFGGTSDDAAAFAWTPGSPVVYAYDHTTGVHRSQDAGQTWARLMSTTTGAADQGGQIAVDPSDARRLYVSSTRTAAGLWRIDDADTVTPSAARPVQLSAAPGLGALAVQVDGTVLVHRQADAAQDAAVWRVADPAGPAPELVRATDGVYAAAAGTVEQLSAAPDGTLYSASTTGGVLVGDPTGTAPDTAPPSAPTGLAATPRDGGGEVVLTWQRAADDVAVTGYEVLRDGAPVAVALTTPTATDRTASPRTTYTYAVRAVDAAGQAGELSEPVTVTTADPPDVTAPDVPAGLHATATTSTSVALAWSEAGDDRATTGYLLYRGDVLVARTDRPSAGEDGLRADTAHAYSVAAVDAAGNTSDRSPAVTVRTGPDTAPPAAPPGLTATSTVPYRAVLTWAAAPDAGGSGTAGYRVRRAGDDGPPLAVLGPEARGWSDTLVRAGTSYAYSVAAVDGAGNVGPASTATVRTPAAKELRAPSRPTRLRAVSTTAGSTRLAWAASSDNARVAGYHVYRDGTYVGDSSTTAFTDPGTVRRVRYGYTVVAFDTSANVSAPSAVLGLTAT